MDSLKKTQKDGKISEDDLKRFEKEVQTVTDKTIKDIGDHLAKKEKELLAV
jgi:ribosome recycling factor